MSSVRWRVSASTTPKSTTQQLPRNILWGLELFCCGFRGSGGTYGPLYKRGGSYMECRTYRPRKMSGWSFWCRKCHREHFLFMDHPVYTGVMQIPRYRSRCANISKLPGLPSLQADRHVQGPLHRHCELRTPGRGTF